MLDKFRQNLNYYQEKADAFRRKRNRNKTLDDEWLPSEKKQNDSPTNVKAIVIFSAVSYVFLLIVFNFLAWLRMQSMRPGFKFMEMQPNGQTKYGLDFHQAFTNCIWIWNNRLPFFMWLMLLFVAVVIGYMLGHRIGYASKQVAYGQKGDSRLTTVKELKEQYKEIPDHDNAKDRQRGYSFKGYGGLPISHYKNKYYIEDGTYNVVVAGQSRAGKGQIIVIPYIDILSRAENQSSMILHDPKMELYNASRDTLNKRGYEVYLLNLADGSNSMSYNPLSLIIKAWEEGDQEQAIQLVNSLTYTLYHQKDAGQNKWVYDGAQSTVSAMIIALIEFCENPDNFPDHKAHPEKIILANIVDMATELGGTKLLLKPKSVTNLMDLYFNNMEQGKVAKNLYASANFMPDQSKGSIYSTITQQLMPFEFPKIARMTSMNSLPLKSIGFPKYFSFKAPQDYEGKIITVEFRKARQKGENTFKLIKRFSIKVGLGGFVEYNFDCKLSEHDVMQAIYYDAEERIKYRSLYQIHFPDEMEGDKIYKDDRKHQLKLKTIVDQNGLEDVKLNYSDKPIAVFINVPDWDSSNNALVSIYINQLYGELAKQCSFVGGNKTIRRVNFILDEFGSLVPIKDMDHIMTISAGRNILFTLILQSYEQLYSKYGRDNGVTIKDNGQYKVLIKSDNKQTNQEFSEAAGHYTAEAGSVHRDMMNVASGYNAHAEAIPVVSTTTLSQMLEEDDLVLRPLHRRDLKGNRVRPYPIFNHGKTKMPFAYTFLSDEFEPATDPNLVKIESIHQHLDLRKLKINYIQFLKGHVPDKAVEVYEKKLQDKNADAYITEQPSESDGQSSDNGQNPNIDVNKEMLAREEENSKFVHEVNRFTVLGLIPGKDIADALTKAWQKKDRKTYKALTSGFDNKEVIFELDTLWNKEVKEEK